MDQEFLEKLKYENPINEVMRENGVELKTSGRGYMCKCPFHDDSTASCSVVPSQGFFHCFGCGVSGDVVTFVRKYRSLSFMDAVNYLAQRAGMTVPTWQGNDDKSYKRRMRIYEMNKCAARFFRDQLKTQDGLRCLNYLVHTRKLSADVIKKYGMGFAPKSFTALKSYMLGCGYSEDELVSASLLGRSQTSGRTYDFFMDRAMFPFIDVSGNIVGFGGRTLGDDKRKYLNTGDTTSEEFRRTNDEKKLDGYSKARFVFSLNYAKDVSVKSRELLLCEGNLDVISLYQHGFTNAVASCGTALTPEQVKVMKNYADRVVICYDADDPGQKAALRAVGMLRSGGLGSSVIHMEGAKDPDEYINKFGEDHFRYLVNNAADGFDFELGYYSRGLDLEKRDDKIRFLKMAYSSIAGEPDSTARDTMERQLAEQYNVSFDVVRAAVDDIMMREMDSQRRAKQREEVRQTIVADEEVAANKAVYCERGLIYYICTNADAAQEIGQRISPDEFTDELNRKILLDISGRIALGDIISVDVVCESLSEEEAERLKRSFAKYKTLNVDRGVAEQYIDSIKEYNKKNAPKQDDGLTEKDYLKMMEELRRKKC
ncbi:DNA primase [Ruminococcus albus SY3]|uniref:DNA primase n=1 Tax=Ruminococcus albus SY3 TaxID=1341156 RepID=A0A011UA69_RUMAL|nr:DNA primase [Ruminococcus albus]EXM37474.1 DNA primase [Ruminococcus albus SY3]